MIECTACGMINPDGASRCDCGHSFERGSLGHALTDLSRPPAKRLESRTHEYVRAGREWVLVGGGWRRRTMDAHVAEMQAEGWLVASENVLQGRTKVTGTLLKVGLLGTVGAALLGGDVRDGDRMVVRYER